MSSFCLRTRLQNSIDSNFSFCKIKIIFKSSTRLAKFFKFKDQMRLCLRSNIVYKYNFGRCNGTYYSETCGRFKVRVGEHSAISTLRTNGPNQENEQPLKTIY